jgi:putative toxin-antitoxin system antitoxin component (TIGR02293 family)
MAGAVRKGFDVETVDRLRVWLGESQDKVLKLTRISSPTLTRRKRAAKKLLTTEESDNVYRVAAVLQEAVQLFEGDEGAARNWLKQPAKALGGSTPLEHLDTTAGADEVRDLIHRLEYGVIT